MDKIVDPDDGFNNIRIMRLRTRLFRLYHYGAVNDENINEAIEISNELESHGINISINAVENGVQYDN